MMRFTNLKLIIFDNDDVLFNSSPLLQVYVEKNWPQYGARILKSRERIISLIQYQYDLVESEINHAREKGIIPNLPNFNINRNDVIRGREDRVADFEYDYYRKPLLEIGESLETAKFDKEMFLENRDATIEADGKLSAEEGKIPYHEIYSEKNWFPYVRQNLNELHSVFGERLISLTAHNGIDDMHGREFEAKKESVHEINPHIEHLGLRFHNSEHIDGVRRPRNNKGLKIEDVYGLDNLAGVVFVDDSLENCLAAYMCGGTPIFVNPNNNPNPYGFAMVKSIKPESIFRELNKTGYSDTNKEPLQKPKILVR